MRILRRVLGVVVFILTLHFAGAASAPTEVLRFSGSDLKAFVIGNGQVFWIRGGDSPAIVATSLSHGQSTILAPFAGGGAGHLFFIGSTIYWMDANAGTISSVPVFGSGAKLLASGLRSPSAPVVDGETLYWVNGGDNGALMKMDLNSGKAQVVVDARPRPAAVAIAGGRVFWNEREGIWSLDMAHPAAPPVKEAALTTVGEIKSDGRNIYWNDGDSINSVSAAGGLPRTLAQSPGARGLMIDGDFLYWEGAGALMKMPLGGGSVTRVSPCRSLQDVAIDGAKIYWADLTDSGTHIYSLSKN